MAEKLRVSEKSVVDAGFENFKMKFLIHCTRKVNINRDCTRPYIDHETGSNMFDKKREPWEKRRKVFRSYDAAPKETQERFGRLLDLPSRDLRTVVKAGVYPRAKELLKERRKNIKHLNFWNEMEDWVSHWTLGHEIAGWMAWDTLKTMAEEGIEEAGLGFLIPPEAKKWDKMFKDV